MARNLRWPSFSPALSLIYSYRHFKQDKHTLERARRKGKGNNIHTDEPVTMFKVHKPSTAHTSPPTTASVDVLLNSLDFENALPKPKILKSCIRCRKHKTKCDAFERQPNACSSCAKRGVQCKIDYVLPPQRSDNLKNLVQSVNEIKKEFGKLESGYSQLFKVLGIQVESFDSWKSQKLANNEGEEEEAVDDLSLIKLPNGSFISLHLVSSDKLLFNNMLISINELHAKISQLVSEMTTLNSIFVFQEKTGYDSDSSTASSAPSPHSPVVKQEGHSPGEIPKPGDDKLKLFDLDLSPESLFNSNRLMLVILLDYFYPSENKNCSSLLLRNFLDSFYTVIESSSKSLTSSTYSTHVLTSITSTPSHFSKQQMAEHVGVEIFNGDDFLRRVVEILGMNALLNGDFDSLSQFIKFVELNVCSNRKKLHLDRSGHMRFFSMSLYLLNVFQRSDDQLIQRKRYRSISKNYELLEDLLCAWSKSEEENEAYLKKLYKKFLVKFAPVWNFSHRDQPWLIQWFNELRVILAMSLIPSFPEFKTVLSQYMGYQDSNKSLSLLIENYSSQRPCDLSQFTLCCPQMAQMANLALCKEQTGAHNTIDIQMILEQVDWRKDSTDDVLKKIGIL